MMDFLELTNKSYLVFGVANRKSVAFHIGRLLEQAGAHVVYVVRNQQRREQVQKILPGVEVYVCDVEHDDQIQRLHEIVPWLGSFNRVCRLSHGATCFSRNGQSVVFAIGGCVVLFIDSIV